MFTPKNIRLISTYLNLFFALSFCFLLVFAKINPIFEEDVELSQLLQTVKNPTLTIIMKAISTPGYPIYAFSSIVILISILLLTKNYQESFAAGLILPLDLLASFIKSLVSRPRPTQNLVDVMTSLKDTSFPSLHVVHFTLFFGLILFYIYTKRLNFSKSLNTIIIFVSSFLFVTIGVSRIYLGAHWLTDVIGGYLLGSIMLYCLIRIYLFLEYK